MPSTVTTERFEKKEVTKKQVEAEAKVKLGLGATNAWIEETPNEWLLHSEWPAIGS
jgi:hypothetical protein